MKCGEQEKTANSPLRTPNSLRHQQHFINKRWLAEQKESSPQTQIDARTIVLLLLRSVQKHCRISPPPPQKKKEPSTHHSQDTNHPHVQPSCMLGCIAATPSWEIVTIFLQFQVSFKETFLLLGLYLETHIKQASPYPRVFAVASL